MNLCTRALGIYSGRIKEPNSKRSLLKITLKHFAQKQVRLKHSVPTEFDLKDYQKRKSVIKLDSYNFTKGDVVLNRIVQLSD